MNDLNPSPRVILRTAPSTGESEAWLDFFEPVEVLVADELDEVIPLLERAEEAAGAGLYAAGFVTYEAAPAFDPAFVTHPRGSLPLAWFGLFREPERHRSLPVEPGPAERLDWRPSIDLESYRTAIDKIRSAIERGETYQANFTFRLRSKLTGRALDLFSRLASRQKRAGHAAFVDIGNHALCSASPELFFSLSDSTVRCRPMKGTARRGLTALDDRQMALSLYDSKKNRAENLMIVDMIRNDLGRVATPGSVRVVSLFDLERYTSVYQLTSSIEARSHHSMAEIFGALFPCASITGAPKVSTTRLLTALETSPRGIYTGAIGHFAPGRRAEFNVAIRTVHIDHQRGAAEYGTGGGIVWDSVADDEYRECATKAAVLTFEVPELELMETMRWEPRAGFTLLDRHLDRLEASADYFDFRFDRAQILAQITAAAPDFAAGPQRFRLQLDSNGRAQLDRVGSVPALDRPWRLAVCPEPVSSDDLFLYHKTTRRDVYDRSRSAVPGYDDALLWNQRGQLTESTIANLVVEIDGRQVTPPVEDGLLAGTFREELLQRGEIEIRSLSFGDLARVTRIWLVNSLRGRIPVDRVDDLRRGRNLVLWRNSGPGSSVSRDSR